MPADLAAHRGEQGARIRAARGERSQRDIANALRDAGHDVTIAAISLWENGRRFPSHKHQLALADALGVTWLHLFAPDEGEVA